MDQRDEQLTKQKTTFVVHDDQPLAEQSEMPEVVPELHLQVDKHNEPAEVPRVQEEAIVWTDENKKELEKTANFLCSPLLKNFTSENVSLSQGALLGSGLLFAGMFVLFFGMMAYLNIHFLLQDGHLRPSIIGNTLPFWLVFSAIGAVPALDLLATKLREKWGNYKLAEASLGLLHRGCACGIARNYKTEGQLTYSKLLFDLGNFKKASTALKRFEPVFPGEDPGFKLIYDAHSARCLAELGELEEALVLSRAILATYDNTTISDTALRASAPRLRTDLAHAFYKCGQYRDALEQAENALQSRYSAKKESRETIADLATLMSNCYRKLNKQEAAKAWTEVALSATEERIQLGLFRIHALIALVKTQMDLGGECRELLSQAKSLSQRLGYDDNGAIEQLLGQLCIKENNFKDAEIHFLNAAMVRTAHFGDNHPLSRQSQASYISAATVNESEAQASATYHKLLSTYLDTQEGSKSAPKQRKPLSQRTRLLLFSLPLLIWSCWSLICQGFRAGGFFDYSLLGGVTIILALLLVAWAVNYCRIARYTRRFKSYARETAAVKFKVYSEKDESFGTSSLYVASIGAPFNCDMVVEQEFGQLQRNLFKLLNETNCSVVHKGGKPTAVETELGVIVLRADDLPVKAVINKRNDYYSRVLACVGIFFMCSLAAFPLLFTNLKLFDTSLPNNLTTYEYYRWGACRLDKAYSLRSFRDLPVIKQSFEKAAAEKGKVGELASTCLKNELPSCIPDQDFLEKYSLALSADTTDKENAAKLEKLIQIRPDFDWAYLSLASINLNHKELGEADSLVTKAEKLSPESIPVALSRAEVESAKGNKTEALKIVQRCLQKDPFYPKAQLQLLLTALGF